VVEAVRTIKDWPGTIAPAAQNGADDAEKLAFIKSIWTSAQPLRGSIAERYLNETRHIDVTRLPSDIHRSLRFHPNCVFGSVCSRERRARQSASHPRRRTADHPGRP
jgi:hypothetical protein